VVPARGRGATFVQLEKKKRDRDETQSDAKKAVYGSSLCKVALMHPPVLNQIGVCRRKGQRMRQSTPESNYFVFKYPFF